MSAPVTMSHLSFWQALESTGMELPKECVLVRIEAPVDGMMQLTFTCNVTPEMAHQLGQAMQAMAVAQRVKS